MKKNGVVITYWNKIRNRVAEVEPAFADIVDELSPDKSFPLFLVYLPYGALKGDTKSFYLPDKNNHLYRLSDSEAPKILKEHLSYGFDGSPMGMVLEKQLEYFIDLQHKKITIPWLIYSPGQFFPYSGILGCNKEHIFAPNGLLTVTSGARSTFMLPNIGCNTHYVNLKRHFNIKTQAPKTLYDHWYVFKDIVQSKAIECDWKSCLLYFSGAWINKIHQDKSWSKLKLYLHEMAWNKFEYERNRIYYDIAFSLIQEKRNLKPNPYLADTAKHLFATAMGATPGYTPCCDEESLPLNRLQHAFVDLYGLTKYIPTIMQPAHFNFEKHKNAIYYSLQHPSTHVFSPKSREVSSTINDILELEHIMRIFKEELSHDSNICSETIIGTIGKTVTFDYYHNKLDRQQIILQSSDLPRLDERFLLNKTNNKNKEAKFASDAPFVRGCVSIQNKLLS